MNSRTLVFLCYALILGSVQARTRPTLCGTYPERWREEIDLNTKSMRRNASLVKTRRADADFGNIAVIESDPSIFSRRNPFNLQRSQVTFERDGAGYRYTTAMGGYDAALAEAGTLMAMIGDDDTRKVELPFDFPFFGRTYREFYLNSDGNLTFTVGDVDTSSRSFGRMAAGPPRISGLFTDLDPSRDGVIRVLASSASVSISWVGVPEYSDFGIGPRQTFQIRIFPNGRITMAWETINIDDAIVGIGPGEGGPRPVFASFFAQRTGSAEGMIAERFGSNEELDLVNAARRFYETHDDAYDYLAFFNASGIQIGGGTIAFESTVRTKRRGIGDEEVDVGAQYGSANRLQAVLNMGPLTNYPADPNVRFPLRGNTGDTGLTVLAHEIGHLFLAFVSVRDRDNPNSRPMLGRQGFHWNFRFNSEASLLEGNRIRDNGEGANPRFATVATVEGYAPLDQYLMGLRAPDEVPPTFLVENSTLSPGLVDPFVGLTFNGTRRDVTVEDVVAVHGRRTPDHTVEQRRFRIAFVLVIPEGGTARQQDIDLLERYRVGIENAYSRYTSQRGSLEATLLKNVRLSLEPAAGALANTPVTVRATVDRPVSEPLAFRLTAESGLAEVPATVTIPANQREVSISIRPLREGVETLRLAATGYLTAEARLAIATAPRQIQIVSGDNQAATPGRPLPQPVVVKVSDANELPYVGVPLTATVSTGGVVQPATAITGADGTASFQWTPSANAANTLRIAATGAADPAVEAVALMRPAFTAQGVVNAASFRTGLTPGGIATIFGSNLRDARVFVNGQAATVFFSSPTQINFRTPLLATLAASVAVQVQNGVGTSDPVTVPFAAFQPGLFFQPATNAAAAIDRGDRIFELYGTGFGALPAQVTAAVGGRPAEVLFAGDAPGFPGLQQINVRAAAELSAGPATVSISVNGIASNEALLTLR